jgi:cytochrome bd-type quinol oxidase subunit 2
MAANDRLVQFVREALLLGRTREEIRAALGQAGWSENEVADALASFATGDFNPPVPCPRPLLTARDTFVYLLLFTSLALVASYLVSLVHGVLDLALPDPTDNDWTERRATDTIRWAIAMLVVFTPVFVWMTLHTRARIAKDAGQRRGIARKWLTYMAMLIAALVFCGDAAYVIYSFLDGEATLRFLLKALTVACVSAGIFVYYLNDIEDRADER